MTLRPLPRSRLGRVLPSLARERTLIALVPATHDTAWAAAAAWDVARALAGNPSQGGRDVTLADAGLESPLLAGRRGLAEAFAADAPLSEVVQEHDGVHLLPAGSEPADGSLLRSNPRWARLQAGFRSQGALLLLCTPAERLHELAVLPESIIALAPGGVDLGSTSGRALLAARGRGSTLLGVVRERGVASRGTGRLHLRPVLVATGAALAIASAALLATAKESFLGHDPAALSSLAVMPRTDSAAWTIQLAAFGTPGRALALAGRLTSAGFPAFVSPLIPDATEALWYRVQVGAFPTRAAAAAARAACQRLGLADGETGVLERAPYSLSLDRPGDVARLQAAGFAAARWGAAGPVLVGAFESPEQAQVARRLLDRVGIATTPISRTEPTP